MRESIFAPVGGLTAHEAMADEALKAVSSGGADGIGTDGQQAIPEDLEGQAIDTLFTEEDLRWVRMVPSVKAEQMYHEFQRVTDLGGNALTPIHQSEGGVGQQTNFKSKRYATRLKTVSLTNKVTGEAEEQETVTIRGSRKPLESNRSAISVQLHRLIGVQAWFGDTEATLSDLMWEGWLEQHRKFHTALDYANEPYGMDPAYCIDMRGKPLTRANVEKAAKDLYKFGWGQATHLVIPPDVSQGFQDAVEGDFKVERHGLDNDGNVIIGVPVEGVAHQGGIAKFVVDNTLSYELRLMSNLGFDLLEGAPAAPAAPNVSTAAGVAGSKWAAADGAGTPTTYYKLEAVAMKGQVSAPSVATAAATVPVGGSSTLTWNTVPGVASYRVLRNKVGSTTEFYEVARVKAGGQITWIDRNHVIPGTNEAFLLEFKAPAGRSLNKRTILPAKAKYNAVCFADLHGKSMRRKDLAPVGDYRAELLYYRRGCQVNTPRRLVRFINIGDRA